MFKLLALSILFFILTINTSSAQDTQVSLLDDISYVFVEKLIATAKENYPKVKTHTSNLIIGQTAINNAKLGWLAPFSLSYVYSPSTTLNLVNPTFFSGYQIGFNLSPGSMLQTPANIKRAKEELKLKEYDRDEYLLQLTTEVKTRYFTYLKAFKILKISNQSYLDAKNSLSMVKYKYERGEATLEEYTSTSASYSTITQGKLDAEVNLLITKASLEELLGVKLEAIPN